MAEFSHEPVLLRECIEMLRIKSNGVYIDGTLGGGGHSSHILENLGKNGILIGLDQDSDAIDAAAERLRKVKDASKSEAEYSIVKTNFEKMSETAERILRERGRSAEADGILLDIGVSSHQFDEPERGFSYRFDAPLDMRMDQEQALTAAFVVNTYPEGQLAKVIREYGEEKWASAIARKICEKRKAAPLKTTFALVECIKAAIPARARQGGGHPAKKTFQAIRIEVNRELDVLEKGIDAAIGLLSEKGRLCVITFHSLEDRIVKNKLKEAAHPCTCPPDFPVCVCGRKPLGKILTNKPIVASEIEQSENNRSHSAKLRVFEKRSDMQ
ncbi:MAG: 16S rRNA (cytosine(1402)-N(4))-methyltransferase RsmH [Clostridia bacterium]